MSNPKKYPINELFYTIQGEALYTGSPALFIRMQGCDVGCPWCDTKHTWKTESVNQTNQPTMIGKDSENDLWSAMTSLELCQAVLEHGRSKCHVVITGGEPCLYDLHQLTSDLMGFGHSVQIETSGTEPVSCHPKTWVTVSPKFKMAGGKELNSQAMQRADEVKFPIGKQQDIEIMKGLVSFYGYQNHKVWLQPLSTNPKATELCIQTAMANGYNLSMQTHKYLGIR